MLRVDAFMFARARVLTADVSNRQWSFVMLQSDFGQTHQLAIKAYVTHLVPCVSFLHKEYDYIACGQG